MPPTNKITPEVSIPVEFTGAIKVTEFIRQCQIAGVVVRLDFGKMVAPEQAIPAASTPASETMGKVTETEAELSAKILLFIGASTTDTTKRQIEHFIAQYRHQSEAKLRQERDAAWKETKHFCELLAGHCSNGHVVVPLAFYKRCLESLNGNRSVCAWEDLETGRIDAELTRLRSPQKTGEKK